MHAPPSALKTCRSPAESYFRAAQPYKLLFNSSVTATRLWRAVEVLRAVDDTLRDEQQNLEGRDRSVAVHGNRLIAHSVFEALPTNALDTGDITAIMASVPGLTRRALSEVQRIVERNYPSNILAALFKNASRCRDVIDKLPDLTKPAGERTTAGP